MTTSLFYKSNGKIVVLLVLLFAFSVPADYDDDDWWAYIDTHGQHPTKQGAYDDAWDVAYEHRMFLGYSYGEVVSATYEVLSWGWSCAMRTRCRNDGTRGLDVFTSRGTASPTAGEHLYDKGISRTCTVSSEVGSGTTREVCTGWTGTGSVPSSGSGNQTETFALNDDSSITWQWATEH